MCACSPSPDAGVVAVRPKSRLFREGKLPPPPPNNALNCPPSGTAERDDNVVINTVVAAAPECRAGTRLDRRTTGVRGLWLEVCWPVVPSCLSRGIPNPTPLLPHRNNRDPNYSVFQVCKANVLGVRPFLGLGSVHTHMHTGTHVAFLCGVGAIRYVESKCEKQISWLFPQAT